MFHHICSWEDVFKCTKKYFLDRLNIQWKMEIERLYRVGNSKIQVKCDTEVITTTTSQTVNKTSFYANNNICNSRWDQFTRKFIQWLLPHEVNVPY